MFAIVVVKSGHVVTTATTKVQAYAAAREFAMANKVATKVVEQAVGAWRQPKTDVPDDVKPMLAEFAALVDALPTGRVPEKQMRHVRAKATALRAFGYKAQVDSIVLSWVHRRPAK